MRAWAILTALTIPAAALADSVTIDGHDVWYAVQGEIGAEPPILLLHGGMMNSAMMLDALGGPLADARAVITLDQQGHGHTAGYDGPTTLDSMRADTLGVLDALGVKRAHVVGFSMGGMLGLDLAVNAPGRVASLTAISASQNADGMLPDLMAMNRDPSHQPSPEVAALLPDEEDFAEMAQGFAEQNPDGAAAMQTTMAEAGALITSDWGWSDDQLAAIDLPVQLAIGDRDFILPTHALHMADTIPGAWLAILPDTTHMGMLDHPALPGMILRRMEAN